MKIKKTLLYMASAVLAGVCFFGNTWAMTAKAEPGPERVFDEAGLFTEEEKSRLEGQLLSLSDEMGMYLGVLTTEDTGGSGTEQYADTFYEEYDLGTGRDHSGALCVIDMDNRQLYISTEGDMIRFLTDERITLIMDNAIGYVGDEEYARGVYSMLEEIKTYVAAGIVDGQYNYDRDTGKVDVYKRHSLAWYEVLFALFVSGGIAVIPCISTVKQYKMESEKKQALNYHMAYRGASVFAFTLTNDLFINKMVSQRRINQNIKGNGPRGSGGMSSAGRSTVHRSSGGRTHGGGGRGF